MTDALVCNNRGDFYDTVTHLARSRRKDPNYGHTSVDLPKPLLLKVRSVCALNELTFAEAVETGLALWLESMNEEVPEWEPPVEGEDKRRRAEE